MNRKLVTEEDLQNVENPLIYDMGDMTPSLPDSDEVLRNVVEILDFMCTDEMIELKYKSVDEFEKYMEEKFSDFADKYFAIFSKLISGEDITILLKMLAAIKQVNTGQRSLEEVEKELGEELAASYIH